MHLGESPIQLAEGTLRRERHICALFNSLDEEHRVLRSFITEGFDRGEKAVHIVDPERWHDHLARLGEFGIDVEQAVAREQLDVRLWQETYLRADRFDQDAMLASMEELLSAGREAAYRRTRLLAHMEWALLDKPGVEDLVEYETRLNYVLPKYEDPVICSYDLSRFGARVVVDIMRTHPVLIVGGVLLQNPFFVPPDQFLLELRERDASRLMRRALRDLVALSAIPTAWVGREPPTVAAGLTDVLVESLHLDFAFVRLCDPDGGPAVEATRGEAWKGFPEWLERRLADEAPLSRSEIVPQVGNGDRSFRGVVIPIGVSAERGLVAAASDRARFPDETDHLLLSVAGNHAATAFQSARLLEANSRAKSELSRLNEELERRVVERTSQLVRVSDALRETQAELAHINRVAAMGQLAASISHEVKQPIAAGITSAQAALRWLDTQPPDLEEVRQALARIVHDVNRAADVIDRIRALIKKAPPRSDRVQINEAICEVIALTHGELVKQNIAVQTQLAGELPLIQGDRVQLQQVIINLIINAVEAMSGARQESPALLIATREDASGRLLVTVKDSGPGLDLEDTERLFDAFYTTKLNGMGMGLSICRSIIEAHGGKIWASRNVGPGATFQFTLPVVSAAEA